MSGPGSRFGGIDPSAFGDRSDLVAVQGGIAARGDFGVRWWSRRFVDAAAKASGASPDRLAQGMDYARLGQTLSLDVAGGTVSAVVQGTAARPHDVGLRLRALSDAEWRAAAGVLASRAVFAAQLLSGEMPAEVETAFASAGVALFPEPDRSDFSWSCSCPEGGKFCEHAACVCYLLAERLDEDPFALFAMRGRRRDEVLADLRAMRPEAPAASSAGAQSAPAAAPASAEARTYWGSLPAMAEERPVVLPGQGDALLRELDPALRLRADPALWDVLGAVYAAASEGANAMLDLPAPDERDA